MNDFKQFSVAAMINSLANAADENAVNNPGDYVDEEGLLVCGKCKTRKQGRYEMPWGVMTPYCLCKCEAEKRDREREQEKMREMEHDFKVYASEGATDFELLQWLDWRDYKKSERLIAERKKILKRLCFADSDMQSWTFAADDGANDKISKIAQNYAKQFEKMKADGKGLLLFGECGTGKTFIAACIANALLDEGVPVYMTNFATIANTVSGMFKGKQEYYDDFNKYPLLVIDDLSAERKTEYMQEIVFNVIDTRYRAGLPIIVTTNLTAEELKKPADTANKRTYSRLMEMCIPIEVKGTDRRRAKLKDDFAEYMELLNK